jgi:hypothetical protein
MGAQGAVLVLEALGVLGYRGGVAIWSVYGVADAVIDATVLTLP